MLHASKPIPSAPSPATVEWLDALPAAVLQLDDDDRVCFVNARAREWLGEAVQAGAALPASLAQAAAQPDPPPVQGPGGRWLSVRRSATGATPRLLLIADVSAEVSAEVAARQTQARDRVALDLMRQVGRIGIWERELGSHGGHWDPQVYRLWGLDPARPPPDFAATAAQMVDEDGETMRRCYLDSLAKPGVYACRYRVRRPDGGIAHLHSHWWVPADPAAPRVTGIVVDDTEVMALARAHAEARSQIALAADLAGLIFARHDLRTGRYHFNEAGWRLIGIAPQPHGVPAAQVAAHMHPEDREASQRANAQALQDRQPVDTELRVIDAAGQLHHLLMRGVVELDDAGAPAAMLSVALDVTRQHAQAAQARGLRARFDLAARTAGIGYWSYEVASESVYWSDQMRALHGIAPGAPVPPVQQWRATFVHPDDRALVRQVLRDWAAGSADSVQLALRIVHSDGEVRHLLTHSMREGSAQAPTLFGIAIDVSERRRADEALRRADERGGLVARGAGIGTWELDLRNRHLHWDAQMWLLRGLEPRAQTPTNDEMFDLVHPDDRSATWQQMKAAASAGGTAEYTFRVVWPDASVHWLASRSTTVLDPQGRAERRIGVNWDITAARLAETERRDREAAEQANAAKSRFLARMSHELRTPLNAVLGFTQLLLARASDATARDWLGHVESAGQHLLLLINDVLDLASLESGELPISFAVVELETVVDATLVLLQPQRAALAITLQHRVPPLRLWSDATRLRQVLINLIGNALKYNRRGGRVDIGAHAEGDHAVLTIADSGRGMSAAQLRQLYEPFNRLGIDREGIEGTGIGLTIVKALVGRLDGSIAVESEVGVGTRFELRLPLAPPR